MQETLTASGVQVEPLLKAPTWERRLSDIFWVNSVAISNDGSRVIGATFLHNYRHKTGKGLPNVQGRFGVVCFDENVKDPKEPDKPQWIDEYEGWDGVFGVAISGDGSTAAAGGWNDKNGNGVWGMLRAYNAANGKVLLDETNIKQRVSWVSLSQNGLVLAAVADDVYVFFREAGEAFNPVPARLGVAGAANRYVTNVAIHPDGTWLAACDKLGHVYVATLDLATASIGPLIRWTAPDKREIPFLTVAIAADANKFIVAGGNSVFLFDFATFGKGAARADYGIEYDTSKDAPQGISPVDKVDPARILENVRWAAVSSDAELVTVVANRHVPVQGSPIERLAGVLVALKPGKDALELRWAHAMDSYPNCTSTDARGQYVAACDGYPTGKSAKFYLFNKEGVQQWYAVTHNMNWPIVISADGRAIAAGSDDGAVYRFVP